MTPSPSESIGRSQWLALTAALLGWMFDGAEMGIFSMVGRAALKDLMHTPQGPPGEAELHLWFGVIMAVFLVGASTGGVVFGWLGDRLGRVRAMTLSVLTYAVFTGLCGLVNTPLQLGALRFIAALGMGGEWSLGVALVMEVWPNRSRAFMAGLIGAAANVGYLLVGLVGLGLLSVLAELSTGLAALGFSPAAVDWLTRQQGWRLLMLLGTAPALLTFFIRIFVPESDRWQEERSRGATSHWQSTDLLAVLVGALGPALIIYLWAASGSFGLAHTWPLRLAGTALGLAIATWGYTFPVARYLRRHRLAVGDSQAYRGSLGRMLLAAGLSGVALLGTWGATQWAPSWADKLTGSDPALGAKYYTQIASALGAIVGTIAAALLGDRLGRRWTYSLLCLVSIASLLWFYQGHSAYGGAFLAGAFLIGVCTASFYGWLPLYLPELFRTGVRATGQGFGFNFGRILAAVGTLQAGNLFVEQVQIGSRTYAGGYPLACSLMSSIYLVGMALIWLAPETKGQPLPE